MKAELEKRVAEGWINASKNGNLTLYNYSQRCVFAKQWDDYTLSARGLVLRDDGSVVARPWKKFFNLGERQDDTIPAETPELANKYDGSLVIVFHDGAMWRAVTRGCWDNAQTRYAAKWLNKHAWKLQAGWTYLFELVAPWNRIVVHYSQEDMILLGMVETLSGYDCGYAETRAYALKNELTPVEYSTRLIESLNLNDPTIKNEEGFVARFSSGLRVKLKYQQYLYLHKIVTGLSVKGIWEILASGNQPDFSSVPDEFMDWYRKQRDKIQGDFDRLKNEAVTIFNQVGKRETRKEYALEYLKHGEVSSALFAMLDGKPFDAALWKRCRPEAHEVFAVDEGNPYARNCE